MKCGISSSLIFFVNLAGMGKRDIFTQGRKYISLQKKKKGYISLHPSKEKYRAPMMAHGSIIFICRDASALTLSLSSQQILC